VERDTTTCTVRGFAHLSLSYEVEVPPCVTFRDVDTSPERYREALVVSGVSEDTAQKMTIHHNTVKRLGD